MSLLPCAPSASPAHQETVCVSLLRALGEEKLALIWAGKDRDSSLMIGTLKPGRKSPRRSQSPLRPPAAASCLQIPRGSGAERVVMETGSLCQAPSGTVFRSEAKRLREMLFAWHNLVYSSPAGLTLGASQ